MTVASTKAIFGSPAYEEKPVATIKQLKKQLDKLGVEYPSKAKKGELESLLKKTVRKEVPKDRAPKPRAKVVKDHIKITCMVETMDGKVHEQEIVISNPGGCIRAPRRNDPVFIFDTLKAGLVSKLGRQHIK